MVIGTDLDNCVIDTQSIINKYLIEFTGKNEDFFNIEKMHSYYYEECFSVSSDIVNKAVDLAVSSTDIPIIFPSISVLNWIGELYSPIYFLTSRKEKYRKNTIELVSKLGLNIPYEICLTRFVGIEERDISISHNKHLHINMLNIDIFIEDHPDIIMDVYNKTEATILVFDRPWNRNIKENERIFIMRSWMEIRDFLNIRMNNR